MPFKFNPFTDKLDIVDISNTQAALETITGNSGGAVPGSANNVNLVGSNTTTVIGTPDTNTLTITPTSSGYPITPFVVGPVGQAGYQTIQSAVNAAHAAGGGFIFVQNGAYTENLTLFPNISISGPQVLSGFPGDEAGCYIIGTHTPALTGTMTFNNLQFVSSGDTFFSAAAGSSELNFTNCGCAVANGYFLNVANWTGILSLWDFNPGSGVQDGGINNTGGASIFCFEAGLGAGTAHTMQVSGFMLFNQGEINCPVNFNSGSILSLANNEFFSTLTFAGNTTGFSAYAYHSTGSTPAITMSSSANIQLTAPTIVSSNNPSISGSGAGILTLANATFVGNSNIASTVNLSYGLCNAVNTISNYVTVSTSTYTVGPSDYYISCNPASNAITISLPNAPSTNRIFIIKDRTGNAGTHNITITTVGGSVTIDGSTTNVISSNHGFVQLVFNGTSYEVF
jgi:hypothetical protein